MNGSRTKMLLGCIADDFTGASDLANALAVGGMSTLQFNGLPREGVPECEAGIVSLKTRSIPASQAVQKSLEALSWLQAQGCKQFLFKYCSTFDSTREGNIGPVAEALLKALDTPAALVCPAHPSLGRSIYNGYLFVGDRLLNESGMESRPLNPMTDANLIRWLGHQTDVPIGLVTAARVSDGAHSIRQEIGQLALEGKRLIVCDCVLDRNFEDIGEAISDMRLITGGSGIAIGLVRAFKKRGELSGQQAVLAPNSGPALALAGSCSKVTRQQIEEHVRDAPVLRVDVDDVLACRLSPREAWAWARENAATRLPLIYSSAGPEEIRAAQARYGTGRVAGALEAFFSATAYQAVAGGVRRLIIAGGETSSAVVSALGVDVMRVGPEIDPGVPILTTERPAPLALALKSGNFGSAGFFRKALNAMAGPNHDR